MVNVAFKLSTDTELRKLIYICCLFMNPKSFNHQNKINGSADLIRIVSYIKFWIKTDKIWWISNSIRILQTGSQVIQSCSVSQFPSSYECKWDQQFNPFSVSMSLSKSRERKVGQGVKAGFRFCDIALSLQISLSTFTPATFLLKVCHRKNKYIRYMASNSI